MVWHYEFFFVQIQNFFEGVKSEFELFGASETDEDEIDAGVELFEYYKTYNIYHVICNMYKWTPDYVNDLEAATVYRFFSLIHNQSKYEKNLREVKKINNSFNKNE